MRALGLVAVLAARARADNGITVEASLGAGGAYHGPWGPLLSVFEPSSEVPAVAAATIAGSASVGGWIDPNVALTAHAAVSGFRTSQLAAFLGPELQYWLPPLSGPLTGARSLWLGGGIGVALALPVAAGLGLDARAGVTLHGLEISVEATEGIYHTSRANSVTLSAALLVGVQLR